MKEQLNEKAKRFFEYLLALSSLNGKPVRSYRDYEKTWNWVELGEVEGCKTGNKCDRPTNLLELHKPSLEHAIHLSQNPFPELDRWMATNFKKESNTPMYKHALKIDESIFQEGNSKVHIKIDTKQLSEWKEWLERKNRLNRALSLYDELLEWNKKLEVENDSLELVLAKGLLKWPGTAKEETIELPIFTTTVKLSLHTESGLITMKEKAKELTFEQELFLLKTLPNREQIELFLHNIKNRSITDNLSSELNRFVHLLDPNGKLIENDSEPIETNGPVIINQSLLIIRTKSSTIIRDDLQQIITAIDQNKLELPDSVHVILGTDPKNRHFNSAKKENFLPKLLPNQQYFPLATNDQQKEIIKRIEQDVGVSVHVKSKKEKTFAISNLVSHFLAEGKRILIISQEDHDYKEIKNKIPQEIRELCVPVLSDDTKTVRELEKSIHAIRDKLDSVDVQQLQANIEQNQQLLKQSLNSEESYRNHLQQYAQSEGTPISYENQRLFKFDVAKRLAETNVNYHWIEDELPLIMKFPLTDEEWLEFCTLQNSFQKEDAAIINATLPKLNEDIVHESTFKALLEEERKLHDEIDVQYILPINRIPEKKSSLLIMKALIEEIAEKHHLIEDETFTKFIEDLLSNEKRKEGWIQLLDELKQNNEKALALYDDLIQHKITLPKKLNSEIQLDLMIARERLLSGKKPSQLFFVGKGKTTKYLFQSAVLNGKPLSKLEHVVIIQKHLEYRNLITKLARLYNGTMYEIGIPGIDITWQNFPQLLDARIDVLIQIIDLVEQYQELSLKLQKEQLDNGEIFDLVFYDKLKMEIEHTLNYMKLEKWQEKYEDEIDRLVEVTNRENMHIIAKQFLYAMQEKDEEAWKILINELRDLHKVFQKIKKWRKYVDQLEQKLPLTVEKFTRHFGEIKIEKEQYLEAFVLKKMETWLNENADIDCNMMKEQLLNELSIQKKYSREIVRDAAWASQLARIKEEQKSVISTWKTNNGMNAPKFIRAKKKVIQNAQTIIPVWMMPIEQVLQNVSVTSERFDVIIVDGSNHCDVFSINTLLRGEKVIVVGDSEQPKYDKIGFNREAVAELMHRYIQDVPNRSLFDGDISFYEIVQQHVPLVELDDVVIDHLTQLEMQQQQEADQKENLETLCETAYEADVLKAILAKNYRVIPKVKVGGYTIDLVIEGVHDRLAVECDGEKWQGLTAYEENQQRLENLELAGWKFWHIRAKDFYGNQEKTMEGLWSKLTDLNILPVDTEETSKVLHDFSVNVENEQVPKIQFQIQNKKIPTKTTHENKLSDQFTTDKTTIEFIEEYQNALKKLNKEIPKNPTIIYTNQNKSELRKVSVSKINEIPPELIQNVLINGKISIVKFLNDLGFETIDYRLQDGSLWVVANEEIQPFMEKLEACNVSFRYISNGSQSTKGHPAWYTKIYY